MPIDGELELLTTDEVAGLLKVHPKQIYRLLKRGLPGRRLGREWRFTKSEVMDWLSAKPDHVLQSSRELGVGSDEPTATAGIPSVIAAHGGAAIEELLRIGRDSPQTLLGVVGADRGEAFELLAHQQVLAAGFHGPAAPTVLGGAKLVRIHLVDREVGLITQEGLVLGELSDIVDFRLASRPPTAGVRYHLDRALRQEGLDPDIIHRRARLFSSHAEVACAVVRGDADVGITTRLWSSRLGLSFNPLAVESYGLLLCARDLGDWRIVKLCEIVQGKAYRHRLEAIGGYDVRRTGDIRFDEAA